MSSVKNVRSARLLLRALRNPNEHFRSGRKLWTRFEILSVISAVCVRRTRDEGFEKPVDNYGVSSSSRGTLKEKQGWDDGRHERNRRKPSVHLVRGNDVSHLPGYFNDRRTIGSRTETRKCRNSSLPYLRARADWRSVSSDKTVRFFFSFSSERYRLMIGRTWLPFIELCREFRVIKFSRS